jgi:Ca2+-binding RTX toxin-like protein
MSRMLRKGLLALAACLAFGLLAAPAGANYHLMKIREVAGSSSDQAYVELQMYAAGQNQVSGHTLTFWDADGLVLGIPQPVQTVTLSGPNPPNGQTQRTILIGDSGVAGRDFTVDLNPFFDQTQGANLVFGGAVCFDAIPVDCVSWGGAGFTGAANLPDKSTPHSQPLPVTMALRRDIGRGCSTLLEAADDTNNNTDDFALVPRAPRGNAIAPTEKDCGGGTTPPPGSNIRCRGTKATLIGSPGKDSINGTGKRDVIVAFGGKDTVSGRGGNDLICGNGGKDGLIGGKGKDTLVGGGGPDNLVGGPGGDTMVGQKGNDTCNGGGGTDVTRSC